MPGPRLWLGWAGPLLALGGCPVGGGAPGLVATRAALTRTFSHRGAVLFVASVGVPVSLVVASAARRLPPDLRGVLCRRPRRRGGAVESLLLQLLAVVMPARLAVGADVDGAVPPPPPPGLTSLTVSLTPPPLAHLPRPRRRGAAVT